MDVQVRHRLTCHRAVIDADVVALRLELSIHGFLGCIKQPKEVCPFISGQIKELADVAVGNDQRVARRDRKTIADDHAVNATAPDALDGKCAKGASHFWLTNASSYLRLAAIKSRFPPPQERSTLNLSAHPRPRPL